MSEFEPLLDADSVDAEDVDLENASRPARQKNAKWTALKCTLCIVVSVGLLALAIATSLPVVLQKKGRSEPRPEPGSSVRFAMDVAVNPCENFYAAACGSISAMSKAELRRHHDNMFFHSSSPTSFNDIEYSRLALFRDILTHSNVTELTRISDPTLAAVVSLYNTCEQNSIECALRVWKVLPLALLRTYAERSGLSWPNDQPVRELFERIQEASRSFMPDNWIGNRGRIDDSRLHIYGAQEASSKYYSFPRFDANETWQSAVERVGQWKAETNDAASKQFEEAVMGSPASFIPTHGEKGWTEKREIVYFKDAEKRFGVLGANCMADEYKQYSSKHAAPRFSSTALEEILADYFGTLAAFNAYRSLGSSHPEPLTGLEALTHDQLFFFSHAIGFCGIDNPNDTSHPPNQFRLNNVMAQMSEFSTAFGCPVGSPMNPGTKCGLRFGSRQH